MCFSELKFYHTLINLYRGVYEELRRKQFNQSAKKQIVALSSQILMHSSVHICDLESGSPVEQYNSEIEQLSAQAISIRDTLYGNKVGVSKIETSPVCNLAFDKQ